jgi:hypothetical protein
VRLSRVVAAVVLPAVLLVSGCHAAPGASAPTTGTSADPLSDVESTVDAVEHDLDADSAP